MVLSMIALLLTIAGALVWWSVDGRYRFEAGPKPLAPEHAVDWLPSSLVARWVEAYRPGWVVPLFAGPLFVIPLLVLHDGWRLYTSGARLGTVALCAGAVAIGATAVGWWAWRRFGTPPFVRVLRDHPDEIAWAFVRQVPVINRRGVQIGRADELVLGLRDGRTFTLPTDSLTGEVVLVDLRRRCPGVVITSPDALRRASGRVGSERP